MNDGGGYKGGQPPGGSTWADIASKSRGPSAIIKQFSMMKEASKKERNVLEIRFQRQVGSDANKYVDLETISEYCFTELGLKPELIEAIDLNTGRFETKQIRLKQGVDASKFTSDFPDTYKGYVISMNGAKKFENIKVTFRNVPLEIQDEELLNLCKVYGTVDGHIQREAVNMTNSRFGKIKLTSSTRFAYMRLNSGQSFNNYYWMEGPLPGDQGRRITVLHQGQSQQCSHCLKTADIC